MISTLALIVSIMCSAASCTHAATSSAAASTYTPEQKWLYAASLNKIRSAAYMRCVALETRDEHGNTALHIVASNGYLESLNVLIRAGANVNALNNDGDTPLHLAALWGYQVTAKILLDAGADRMMLNNASETPLDLAYCMENFHMISTLKYYKPITCACGKKYPYRSLDKDPATYQDS